MHFAEKITKNCLRNMIVIGVSQDLENAVTEAAIFESKSCHKHLAKYAKPKYFIAMYLYMYFICMHIIK